MSANKQIIPTPKGQKPRDPEIIMEPNIVEAWKNAINAMTFNQLSQVECKIQPGDNNWKKAFPVQKSFTSETVKCEICGTAALSRMGTIKQHISGKKHQRKFETSVAQVRHTHINPVKHLNLGRPAAAPAATPAAKPAAIPPAKPAPTPAAKPAASPVAKPAASPVSKPVATPAAKPAATPAAKPAATSAAKPAATSAAKPAAKPVAKPAAKPAATSAAKPAATSAAKPAATSAAKPAATSATKPANSGPSNPFKAPMPVAAAANSGTSNPFKTPAAPATAANTAQSNQSKGGGSKIVLNPLSLQRQQSEIKNQNETKRNLEEDLKKFRANLSILTAYDLLLIEYKFVNTDWQKLFKKDETKANFYTCSMCKNTSFNLDAIKSHMANRQHQRNIDLVKGLHHPVLLPLKEPSSNATSKPDENNKKPEVIAGTKNDNSGNMGNTSSSSAEIIPAQTAQSYTKHINKGGKDESQNKNEAAESNVVINPVNVQKRTTESTTTGKNLREMMKTLEVVDLLKIEFRYNGINSEWKKMFTQFPDTTFKCLLCGTFLIKNLRDLRTHIESVRHQSSISATQKLFHPTLAPTKPEQEKEEPPKATNNTKVQKEGPKKMDDKAFREHIPKLHLDDLKKVEYLLNGKWKPLINMQGHFVMCNLCDVRGISSEKTLLSHITGKKHNELMSNVEKLFQPEHTFAKDHVASSNKLENAPPKKTVRASSDSQIICTIEVEDSPEREIPETNAKKNTDKVVNPAAIIAKSNEQNKEPLPQRDNSIRYQYQQLNDNNANMNNQFGMQTGNRSRSDNNSQRSNNAPNFQQSERIITPRVRPFQDSTNKDKPAFSTKDLTSSKVEEIEGLIGVEYVVKILRNVNDTMPRFECCLCEVEVDGVGMQFHLKGLLHRKKYLERHFPTAMRQFSKYKDDPKYAHVISQICEQLAIAVEKYHGRDLPFECLLEEFRSNRDGIMSKVFSFRHASEHSGPSFTNVVDKNMIDQFIANKDNYKAPQPDPKRRPTFDVDRNAPRKLQTVGRSPTLGVEEHRVLVEKFLQNTTLNAPQRPREERRERERERKHRSRSRSPRRRRSRSRSRDRHTRNRTPPKSHPSKAPARSQWELYSHTLKSPVRGNNSNIWDRYRQMFDHAVEDLDRDYKEYKRDPEKHPLYDEEWRKYWVKKSRTLRDEGIDTSNYNFQPGWVRYFSRRVHQLYEEAVEVIRLKCRDRLGLPHHNSLLRSDRYHIGVHCVADPVSDEEDIPEKTEPMRPASPLGQRNLYHQNVQFTPVPVPMPMPNNIQVQQPSIPYNRGQAEFMDRPKPAMDRPQTLIECPINERSINERSAMIPRPRNERSVLELPVSERPKTIIEYAKPSAEEEKKNVVAELGIETGPLNAVSALRLLTALEDQLGSLGPKVIDLLSKALTLEKVKPNSADESLLTADNCVFLETVNEKLKGQILAGVIEGSKMKAVKQAIKDVTALLKKANENLANNPPPPPVIPQREAPRPVKPPTQKRPAPSTTSSTGPAQKMPCLDKQEIASKLAAALAAQGKTDFSADQLEQLVAVYTLIEKKQREASNKSDSMSDPQKKSLSETLLDFLKPGSSSNAESSSNVNQPTRPSVQSSMGQLSITRNQPVSNSNNSMMGGTNNPMMGGTNNRMMGGTNNPMMGGTNNSLMNTNNSMMSNTNRMGGGNYSNNQLSNTQQRSQPSSSFLGSYNFGQLSNFDTSLSLSSLNRNPSTNQSSFSTGVGRNQIWRSMDSFSNTNMNQGTSNMNPISSNTSSLNLQTLLQGITNRGQNSPNMGFANQGNSSMNMESLSMRSGQSSFNQNQSNQQNPFAFNSSNSMGNNNMQANRSINRDDFNSNQRHGGSGDTQVSRSNNRDEFNSIQRHDGDGDTQLNRSNDRDEFNSNQRHGGAGDQRFSQKDQDDRQLFNSAPVVTSTSMRGGSDANRNNPFSGNNSNNNSSMISYPSNSVWRNQASNNSQNNSFRGGNQSQQTPMGWQRNNNMSGRR